MRILHLMSCRGWSSDAYWAARISAELERAGRRVTLVCKRGSDARVIVRAREAGVDRIATLAFSSGIRPARDAADVRTMLRWWPEHDVVHVHRGKEHWLAAAVNGLSRSPRPLVRTRHIVQPVRAHALNRWLYGRATACVVTVTHAIGRQYVASGLVPPDRIVALPGGVDVERFHPGISGRAFRSRLGVAGDVVLVGVLAGLRVMKGHAVVVDAVRRLARAGRRVHVAFVGSGPHEAPIRRAIREAGVDERVSLTGFVPDPPAAIAALDIALYVPLESEGMSRTLFEYLAMGKPVVASRVGVVPEVLDASTALQVPAGEAAPLADAVERLAEDGGLRARLGAAASALARERLSGAAVARALSTVYDRLAAERPIRR
jgi:glycosyltransferase involved in cell wall biosynthesis